MKKIYLDDILKQWLFELLQMNKFHICDELLDTHPSGILTDHDLPFFNTINAFVMKKVNNLGH